MHESKLFVNPPVIRSDHSSAEDDFKIEGFIFNKVYCKIPGFVSIARRLGIGNGVRYGVRAGSRWPWTMDRPHGGPPYPFIMGYAASYLKSNGHEVALMDAVADDEYSYERFIKKVQAEHANIVVIECSTPTIDIDLWITKIIAVFSDVCIAGPHLSLCAQSIKDDNPFIKYFLKGEYIKSCLEMVNTGRPGIYEPVIVEDLDSLPFPLRDYSSALNYFEPTMPTVRPQLQIYSSKGCPFKCTYCMWPQVMYNRKVTYRKPERVAEEILYCANKYGFKSILFDDDTFNVGTERVSRLCDELKKIGLPWTMMGRLDCSPLWPGLSAEQVEVLVTQPIEMAVSGLIGLETVRSESIQGLSIVTVNFAEQTDIYRNRQLIGERLTELPARLPPGVIPIAVPLSSSSATVLTPGLTSESQDLMTVRSLVDWTIVPRLLAVPGVADVNVFGGEIKQLQIQIEPSRLRKFNLALDDITRAAEQGGVLQGGGFIENQNQRFTLQTAGAAVAPAQPSPIGMGRRIRGRVGLSHVNNGSPGQKPLSGWKAQVYVAGEKKQAASGTGSRMDTWVENGSRSGAS